nr:MAG: CHASE2 domain-containing protein [Leptolyngbya sp. IPPAS B-1204]
MNCNLSKWGWRLLPGSISALSMALLLKLGAFQPLEQLGYQALFQLRSQRMWDERLVLVAIDDASVAQIGRFPWARQQYTQLLQFLSDAGANIVVFDLLFSEPSADDRLLAEAMDEHGRVVLSTAWNAEGMSLDPVPVLQQKALGVGHISVRQDSDAIVRQVWPQIQGTLALAIVAAQAYSLMHREVALPQKTAPMWLNWVGDAKSIQQYSFVQVVQGNVPKENFVDKIVLVGVTATGIDPLITPYDRNPPASSVLLHATLLQNLLRQSLLQPLGKPWWLLLFLAGGPLLSWSLNERTWNRQVGTVVGLWVGWLGLSVLLLNFNHLPPVVLPLTLFAITGGATGICDRVRESSALRRQLRHLQRDEALKAEFFRTASHELRTPVANIQTAISLLRIARSPEDWEEYLQILEEECRQEANLINDLLDFQRLSSVQPPIQPETYELQDWLQEVMVPFLVRAEANQQQIELQVDGGSTKLTLDWMSLRRILSELLNNACKYTPAQERIQVRARLVTNQLELVVSNSGVTIPAAELDKIFQPFYRIPELDQNRQGGTGLGLAIIKRLAEYLHGVVEVTNPSNVLMFTVRLPIKVEPMAVDLNQC